MIFLHASCGDIYRDTVIEPSTSVKDLGITFTDDLSWEAHIHNITKSAKKKAGWALSAFRDRSPNVMKTIYKSVVRSLLEYNCPLWYGLSLEDIRSIEAIQRSFTDKINCPSYVEDYWDRLKYLNLMSLQRRRERYVIITMWKIFHKKVSNVLGISFYTTPRMGSCASIPPIVAGTSKAQTLYDKSFAVKGPQLWNIVDKNIKSIVTLEQFKIKLDTFLAKFPDKPPVAGYVVQNNNSLLEWRSSAYL